MAEKFRTTKAAHLESLGAFRDFIESICRKQGIDSQTCYELKLATDEACTNIIAHGYANMNPGTIILDLELDARQAVMRITDFGHPFEPYEPETPDVNALLEDQPTSGFGLFIIYKTMDNVDYKTTEASNILILTKRLARQKAPA